MCPTRPSFVAQVVKTGGATTGGQLQCPGSTRGPSGFLLGGSFGTTGTATPIVATIFTVGGSVGLVAALAKSGVTKRATSVSSKEAVGT